MRYARMARRAPRVPMQKRVLSLTRSDGAEACRRSSAQRCSRAPTALFRRPRRIPRTSVARGGPTGKGYAMRRLLAAPVALCLILLVCLAAGVTPALAAPGDYLQLADTHATPGLAWGVTVAGDVACVPTTPQVSTPSMSPIRLTSACSIASTRQATPKPLPRGRCGLRRGLRGGPRCPRRL